MTMCLSFLFHLETLCMWQATFEFHRWEKLSSEVTGNWPCFPESRVTGVGTMELWPPNQKGLEKTPSHLLGAHIAQSAITCLIKNSGDLFLLYNYYVKRVGVLSEDQLVGFWRSWGLISCGHLHTDIVFLVFKPFPFVHLISKSWEPLAQSQRLLAAPWL